MASSGTIVNPSMSSATACAEPESSEEWKKFAVELAGLSASVQWMTTEVGTVPRGSKNLEL